MLADVATDGVEFANLGIHRVINRIQAGLHPFSPLNDTVLVAAVSLHARLQSFRANRDAAIAGERALDKVNHLQTKASGLA